MHSRVVGLRRRPVRKEDKGKVRIDGSFAMI